MKYLPIIVIVCALALATAAVLGQDKTTVKQYADGNLIGEYEEITILMPDGVVFEVCK